MVNSTGVGLLPALLTKTPSDPDEPPNPKLKPKLKPKPNDDPTANGMFTVVRVDE